MDELGHFPGRRQALAETRDPLLDQFAAKAAGNEIEIAARIPGAGRERPRQAIADFVEALHGRREHRFGRRPAARNQAEPLAPALDAPAEAMAGAVLKFSQLGDEL